MYTELPHDALIEAVDWLFAKFEKANRHRVVSVPRCRGLPAKLGKSNNVVADAMFSLQNLKDIILFDLRNCFFSAGDVLLQQKKGVPMGSPLSPVLAILICAYYEHKWLESKTPLVRARVAGIRYVDDTHNVVAVNGRDASSEREARVLLSEMNACYHRDMEVQEEKIENNRYHFLETTVECRPDGFEVMHRNKNFEHLLLHGKQKLYRYQHFFSFSPYRAKKGVVISALSRIARNCSSDARVIESVFQLFVELQMLRYPRALLLSALDRLWRRTGKDVWMALRSAVGVLMP